MKGLKKFLTIVLVAGVGCALYYAGVKYNMSDKAVEIISNFYGVKKADAVNSEKVSVYVNNKKMSEKPSLDVFMTEKLVWMADAQTVSRIFECEVERLDKHTVAVTGNHKTSYFSDESEIVQTTDGEKLYKNSVILERQRVCLSLEAVSEILGSDFQWDEKNHSIRIMTPVQQIPVLPVKYDLRQEGRLMPARSQGSLGTCWAFAALSAIESTLLPGISENFAVDHMSMLNGFNISQNDGGDYNIALAYMASWKGPVYEADDPYGDNVTDERLKAVRHLQEAVNIPSKDYITIKETIKKYGAVQSSFYSDIEVANAASEFYNVHTSSYYYNGTSVANHDVIIIGWDDHYPKENFNIQPEHDGAFICQNSWGKDFGEDGCFYVSYDDVNIGKNNMVYTRVEPADNYGKIYQSDQLGWIGAIGYNEPFAYFANKYHADGIEALKAVSFYATAPDTSYEVYVVAEDASRENLNQMRFIKSGVLEHAGYYTVPFESGVSVSGDFAVIVKIITKDAVHPVAIEYDGEQKEFKADIEDGEGYISYNGKYWQSAEENYSCNLCLKAFTNPIK